MAVPPGTAQCQPCIASHNRYVCSHSLRVVPAAVMIKPCEHRDGCEDPRLMLSSEILKSYHLNKPHSAT